MACRIPPFLVVVAVVAAASLFTMSAARAQADTVDPPDVTYQTGAVPENPAVDLRRAIVKRHRAFLPPSADLSSRMPEVGDQRQSQSCTAWAAGYAARSYYTGTLESRNIRSPANLPSPNYLFHLARQGNYSPPAAV